MGGRGGGGWRGGGGRGGGGVTGGQGTGGNQGPGHTRESRENVKKFLTFYKRTKSICIDLYCPAFYKRKPYYDELADFVYDILCPNNQMRADLVDVQLHPVKKNLFIKFKTVQVRDAVAERLAGEGLEWPAFNTKVQGWAMDKPMVFVRVLGSSPESSMQDVKNVMSQYGEVLEVRKGKLSNKLPHVTNGTWTVRLIVGEGKVIPSFVFVNDDGEIWQLAHDNQETICWQCGQQGHIGSRCNQRAVSIEHDLLAADQGGGAAPAPPVQTWAHVVRGGAAVVQRVQDEGAQRRLADNEQRVAAEAEQRQGELAGAEQREREAAVQREKDTEQREGEAAELRERKATERRQREADELQQKETDKTEQGLGDKSVFEKKAAVKVANVAANEPELAVEPVATPVEGLAPVEGAAPMKELKTSQMVVEVSSEVGVGVGMEPTEQVDNEVAKLLASVGGTAAAVDFDLEEELSSLKSVKIFSPSDNIVNPAKVLRLEVGSAVLGSGDPQLGSSPDLHHKDPRPSQSQSTDVESLSDAGSSNAFRPGSDSLWT